MSEKPDVSPEALRRAVLERVLWLQNPQVQTDLAGATKAATVLEETFFALEETRASLALMTAARDVFFKRAEKLQAQIDDMNIRERD